MFSFLPKNSKKGDQCLPERSMAKPAKRSKHYYIFFLHETTNFDIFSSYYRIPGIEIPNVSALGMDFFFLGDLEFMENRQSSSTSVFAENPFTRLCATRLKPGERRPQA